MARALQLFRVVIAQALGWLLATLGGALVAVNACTIVVNWRNHRRRVDRYVSMVPLIGPLLASVGLLLLRARLDWWLSLPWILDIGTWTILVAGAFAIRRALQARCT